MSASNRPDPAPDDSTTERLVDQLRERHWLGLKKYGTTLDRTDLDVHQWIQHHRLELLDALGYPQRVDDWCKDNFRENTALIDTIVAGTKDSDQLLERLTATAFKLGEAQGELSAAKARIAELEKQFAERG
jgi:hypothetical protein